MEMLSGSGCHGPDASSHDDVDYESKLPDYMIFPEDGIEDDENDEPSIRYINLESLPADAHNGAPRVINMKSKGIDLINGFETPQKINLPDAIVTILHYYDLEHGTAELDRFLHIDPKEDTSFQFRWIRNDDKEDHSFFIARFRGVVQCGDMCYWDSTNNKSDERFYFKPGSTPSSPWAPEHYVRDTYFEVPGGYVYDYDFAKEHAYPGRMSEAEHYARMTRCDLAERMLGCRVWKKTGGRSGGKPDVF